MSRQRSWGGQLPRYAASLVALGSLALAAACGGASNKAADPSASATGGAKLKVALLFDGQIDDHAWNQAGFAAVAELKAAGMDVAYSEKVDHATQVETFRNYAQQGYNLIIGTGGDFTDTAAQAAKEFPDVKFVVVNGGIKATNLGTVSLNYPQMGYLAGAFAAGLTKSHTLGFVGGVNIPIVDQAAKGFEAGAKAFDPANKVRSTITGDWADVDKAREASIALVGQGADVLWYVLDAAQTGLMGAAEDKNVSAIASYFDQSKVAPKAQAGLVTVDVAKLVAEAAKQAPQNAAVVVGVPEGFIGLDPRASAPAAAAANVTKAIADIKSGIAKP